MRLFGSFLPSGVPKGERSEAESSPSTSLTVKTTFMPSGDEALHFGPLCGPSVEMTQVQIIITISINQHSPENLQFYIILIATRHRYKSTRQPAITVVITASNLLRSQMIPTMPNIKATGDEKIRSNPPRVANRLLQPGLHISITTIVTASRAKNAADIFPNRTMKFLQRVSCTGLSIILYEVLT